MARFSYIRGLFLLLHQHISMRWPVLRHPQKVKVDWKFADLLSNSQICPCIWGDKYMYAEYRSMRTPNHCATATTGVSDMWCCVWNFRSDRIPKSLSQPSPYWKFSFFQFFWKNSKMCLQFFVLRISLADKMTILATLGVCRLAAVVELDWSMNLLLHKSFARRKNYVQQFVAGGLSFLLASCCLITEIPSLVKEDIHDTFFGFAKVLLFDGR